MMRFVVYNNSFLLDSIFFAQIPALILQYSPIPIFLYPCAQVPAPEPDASDGSGPDAGPAEPAAHGRQETEGGRIKSLMGMGGK